MTTVTINDKEPYIPFLLWRYLGNKNIFKLDKSNLVISLSFLSCREVLVFKENRVVREPLLLDLFILKNNEGREIAVIS